MMGGNIATAAKLLKESVTFLLFEVLIVVAYTWLCKRGRGGGCTIIIERGVRRGCGRWRRQQHTSVYRTISS